MAMKVLLISAPALPCPPPSYGGLEQVVYDLASALVPTENVTVACPIESKLPPGVKHLVSNFWSANDRDERVAFSRIKKNLEEFDIVHDHTHFKFFYYWVRENSEAKYIATLHNPELILQPELFLNLVSPSKANSDYFFSKYGYRTKIVYHGIDTSKYKFSRHKEDYFLIMGRPQPIKGSLEAVRFCKELNVACKVVAGGLEVTPTEYWIKLAQECEFKSKWEYLGEVSHRRKIELLSKAKAYIFPLNWDIEPFGLVVVEALASGTPVIAYDKGPMRELIKPGVTGYLPKTPAQFKKAMKKIHKINPLDCYKDALSRFDKSRMASDYLTLYKEILEGARW